MHRKYIYILTLALSISLLMITATAPAQAEYSQGIQLLKQQIFDPTSSQEGKQVCVTCHNLSEDFAMIESAVPVVTQFTNPAITASRLGQNPAYLDTSSPALQADIGLSLEQELTIAVFMRSLPSNPHSLAMSLFIPLVNR